MKKYSAEQINEYVKGMHPQTQYLVGTAMAVLKCDEECAEILADESRAFSVRIYLFALIAEGFCNDDIKRFADASDIFSVIDEVEKLRERRYADRNLEVTKTETVSITEEQLGEQLDSVMHRIMEHVTIENKITRKEIIGRIGTPGVSFFLYLGGKRSVRRKL